jgi:hypothetical protein
MDTEISVTLNMHAINLKKLWKDNLIGLYKKIPDFIEMQQQCCYIQEHSKFLSKKKMAAIPTENTFHLPFTVAIFCSYSQITFYICYIRIVKVVN